MPIVKFIDSLKAIKELAKGDRVLAFFLILWGVDLVVDAVITVWVIYHHLRGGP